jgi:hypothetical protein
VLGRELSAPPLRLLAVGSLTATAVPRVRTREFPSGA